MVEMDITTVVPIIFLQWNSHWVQNYEQYIKKKLIHYNGEVYTGSAHMIELNRQICN